MIARSVQDLKKYYNSHRSSPLRFIHSDSCNQIVLIRHGEPDLVKDVWANRNAALDYVRTYDSVGVLPLVDLHLSLEELKVNHVFSSPTPRAFHTAQLLFTDRIEIVTDHRFREFERKIFRIPWLGISLPLQFWLVFSRVLWLLGLNSSGIESKTKAYIRGKENAEFLIDEAVKHENAFLVAHGFHNKVVADALVNKGWLQVYNGGRGYAAINIFAKKSSVKIFAN